MKKNSPAFFKSIGYVTIGTILGKISGFLKHYLVVYLFGLSNNADAFFVANIIPEMLVNILISGLLAGAFIPIASEVLTKEGKEHFSNFISALFVVVGILSFLFGLFLFFSPEFLAELLAPGYNGQQLHDLAKLLQSFSVGTFFLGLAAILSGVLQSLEDFRIVSFGLFIYNVTFIGTLWFLKQRYQMLSAGIGISLGAFFWFLSHLLFTYKIMKLKPKFKLVINYLKKTGRLALPSLLIITLSNFILLLEKNFASVFQAGTISELNLAFRLSHLFLIILILPSSTVLLPRLIKYFSQEQYEKMKKTIQNAVQIITAVLILFLIFFIYNALLVTKVTYYFLHVDSKNMLLISEYALWYSFSFLGLFYYMFLLRVFYSMQKIWEIVKANTMGLFVYLAAILILVPRLKSFAFPLSYAMYALTTTVYLAIYLNVKIFPEKRFIVKNNEIFYSFSLLILISAIGVKIFFSPDHDLLKGIFLSLIFIGSYIYFLLKVQLIKKFKLRS